MAIRNLVAMLGLVTLLVACGDKNDGGGDVAGYPAPNPYGQQPPYGQEPWMGDLNNPNYVPGQNPAGFQAQIPGCQVQSPVFQQQSSYCEWLGNQQVWNNCGFEARRSVFERDCRAYREVHGSCFRSQPRPITDQEIDRIVQQNSDIQDSRLRARQDRWDDLMEDIESKRQDPNYGRQVPAARPVVRQPVQQPAQEPVQPAPIAQRPPTAATAPVVHAPAPAAPQPPFETVEDERPLDLSQCIPLERIHNTLKDSKNNISSIADVILPASVQDRIDAAPKITDTAGSPVPKSPLDTYLKGYITAAEAPFGTYRYVGKDSKDRPKLTGWPDGSALGRTVTQTQNGSIVIMNDTTVGSALILTGRITDCRDNQYMTVRFQESMDKVIRPFTAHFVWNKGAQNVSGQLVITMEGDFTVEGQTHPYEATRFVLWRQGSSQHQMRQELELQKAIMRPSSSQAEN